MKKLLLILFSLAAIGGFAQQQILLLTENFESPSNTFDFVSGGVGTNTGNNMWTINKKYSGAPSYPDTPPEDSIVSGNITNAPHSTYLHIVDSLTAANSTGTIANCNWAQNTPSDRFCFLNNGFCSLGMTNVIFTFFWVAGGDTDAYGELYYSANSGPWTKTGRAKYTNQDKWQYEVVSDPAFNNVKNLRFGFRWVNPTKSITPDISFGIDDIIAVGTYDDVNHPAHIKITAVSPDSVCQNDYLFISYKLTEPLCDAQYQIEILNSNLQIVNGPSFPVFSINAPDTVGSTAIQAPSTLSGNCFHIRLVRVSPAPMIVGDTSICFSIIHCPTSIFTTSAPVMNDIDTTCILSEIDVKFYSFGTFNNGNIYYAELSDSNGSFAAPYTLGSLPSKLSYQGPPGTVSGVIPASVPPGCGYYIRVRGTNPITIGTLIGPFCLTHCDMETNNITDLNYCIRYPNGTDTNILHIQVHHWNNQAVYDTCNNFTVQLLDMTTFAVVNTGGIGIFHDNKTDSFLLIVGPYSSLAVAPGTYYMRILSNCSSQTWNQTGTVIRITIGAPNPIAPVVTSPDSIYCNSGFVNVYVNPFNDPPSHYEWLSNGLNNGLPFIWDFNPLTINFTNAPVNTYSFQVREINYGCPGPWSGRNKIDIITLPKVHIRGPVKVCLGDTATFYVDYLPRTYYNWTAPAGVRIIVQGNSQVSMAFDSIGSFDLFNYSLNACGSDSGYYTVQVAVLFTAHIDSIHNVCKGDSLHLLANTWGEDKALLVKDSSITGKPGAMFNLIAHDDLIIDSFACKILIAGGQQASVDIFYKVGTYLGYEQNAAIWNYVLTSYPIVATTNRMTTLPDWVDIPMLKGDTLGVYLTTIDVPHTLMAYSPPGAPPVQGTLFRTDGTLDYIQGCMNDLTTGDQPFGPSLGARVWNGIVYYHTKAGLHYRWNTGDTTAVITANPSADSLYKVLIFDNQGCKATDTALIKVNPLPTVNVGPDTLICDGLSYVVPGVTSANHISWSPSTGLDNANIITPTFKYSDTVNYVITVRTDSGCSTNTHLKIAVQNCTSYIHVADAFTPNGDSHNQHFTLFANRIATYNIKIYNRWGELVYESSDMNELNDTNKGWDGTYQGKDQNIGTFVYYLTATDDYGKSISKKGNLTLIR